MIPVSNPMDKSPQTIPLVYDLNASKSKAKTLALSVQQLESWLEMLEESPESMAVHGALGTLQILEYQIKNLAEITVFLKDFAAKI